MITTLTLNCHELTTELCNLYAAETQTLIKCNAYVTCYNLYSKQTIVCILKGHLNDRLNDIPNDSHTLDTKKVKHSNKA